MEIPSEVAWRGQDEERPSLTNLHRPPPKTFPDYPDHPSLWSLEQLQSLIDYVKTHELDGHEYRRLGQIIQRLPSDKRTYSYRELSPRFSRQASMDFLLGGHHDPDETR
jgi:hypothetical protein